MSAQDENILMNELAVISETLESIERRVSAIRFNTSEPAGRKTTPLLQARLHYQSRRDRDKLFGKSGLFGEPAWDMLVVLFIAAEEGRQMNVLSLCFAITLQATSALRWISILETNGLIERINDGIDPRRAVVSLTPNAKQSIISHFEQFGQ